MNVDPERINADHWCEQHFRAATLFIPYLPMQPAQQEIPQRPPGIDANGDPDPNDPGHPGQPALPFNETTHTSSLRTNSSGCELLS